MTKQTDINTDLPFFKALPEASRAAIIPHAALKTLDKHQPIFLHGDPAESFYIIQHGWVKCTHTTLDGKESITSLATSGDCLGEAALLSEKGYYSTNANTLTPCELITFSATSIQRALQNNHELAMHLLTIVTRHKSGLELQIEHLTSMTSAQRIGCFLLKLCHYQLKGDTSIELPTDKSIIANYLGITAETFSRGLQALKEYNITVDNQLVYIRDIKKLRGFACMSCSNPKECEEE